MCRKLAVAVLVALFSQAVGRCEHPRLRHTEEAVAEENISIVRVKDDMMVKWFCPGFQKTSLLILNGEEQWEILDSAFNVNPQTQYSSLHRNLRKGFFRTSQEELQESPRLRVMMPSVYISDLPIPVRIEVLRPDGSFDWEVWDGEVSLDLGGDDRVPISVPLHNGIASCLLPPATILEARVIASYNGEWAEKSVSEVPPSPNTTVAGELSEPLTVWKPGDGIVHVTGDVTLAAGSSLRIYPDTIVLLNPKKSITVRGAIECLGTVEHPVLFAAADAGNPWGQIHHDNAATKSFYRGTFFVGGGDSPAAGHTGRGPAVRVSHSEVEFDHCNFMDNYGKGLYASLGDLTFKHCLFSRCVMGMEVVDVDIAIDRCHFIEMPMGGDVADNDPLYLHGHGNMTVTNSIFAIGGDDGIDLLSSSPVIQNCIVHGFLDKGISVYYGGPHVENCLIFDNDYGISAKGDPTDVYVDRTSIVRNRVSIQSRNKYNEPDAVIKYYVTNSILWDHDQGVQTDYPVEDISITYSDVQGDQPFAGEGNINDDPLFVAPNANDFRLQEHSPCLGAGENGVHMGCNYSDLP